MSNMKKFYLFLLVGLGLSLGKLEAQSLKQFSEDRSKFMGELQAYMTASKRKVMEETYKAFEQVFKNGTFTEEEVTEILETSNLMLSQRMSASPYFSNYLEALTLVKKTSNGDQRFAEWHDILRGMLTGIENRRLKPFQTFLKFSINFFKHQAIRYSQNGTSWYTYTDQYLMRLDDEGNPVLEFDEMDLMAKRSKDSIFIYGTSGIFYPVKQLWKGRGGKVTWERFGFDKTIYAELSDYELDAIKSLYEAKKVRMHFPLFFGNKVIEGDFADKLSVANQAQGGSYPRFESYERALDLKNIGGGVEFLGGFRLHGTTVYGFGSKENQALVKILNDKDQLIFRGESELFTIRENDRIVGERVESTFYFGQDSIYHPSVNLRFDIEKKEIQLSRGNRGSDRNPFFSSVHKVNIDADKIHAYIDQDSVLIGKKSLAIAKRGDVQFESLKYFQYNDYQRVQNISTSNPLAIMKVTAEKELNNFIPAGLIAKRINSKFTVENIQSLLYDLVAQGFINYDSEKQVVEVKDKVFHYADAAQQKVDYDVLKIKSKTDNTNAVLNLSDNSMTINGISSIEFSPVQQVGLIPDSNRVVMKENRDMEFQGRLFAGYTILEGKGFHFDYDKFQIGLDSVRFFDMYVPTGELDKNQNPIAMSIGSRVEYLNGVLLIDAPSNKSGQDSIGIFPSLQAKDKSYVFYDSETTQGGAYTRDSFFFEVKPFSFNRLDTYTGDDINLEGTLVSHNIFPEFEETLVLREKDESLGFATDAPDEGFPAYLGKGTYKGVIDLSNQGLLGQGNVQYLGASINSDTIIFKPKQMLASADRFDLEEVREADNEVPQAKGINVKIDWRPYKDSMYINSREETPFELFKENNHTLDGTLILTPGGLKGVGVFDWDKATMQSKLFSFGAFSAFADTTDLKIRAFNADELALKTSNVNGIVDFDEQVGTFKANDEFLVTELPYNQYETSMNEFNWNMEEETITFKADSSKFGKFLSVDPERDSLRYLGEAATYDLKTSKLQISGVPYIVTADAFVFPDSNYVEVDPGGMMKTLNNAKIVADTLNQYHVINRATVDIYGRKYYEATGFYEYNIGEREQEIDFNNIIGHRVGKGAMSQKRVVTTATGEVRVADNFYIDHKTEFRGQISLNAGSKNLQFDGFARLDADKLPSRQWFTISSEGDKRDLAIRFNTPKNYEGEPLKTGLFLSKETAQIYPRVMMPLDFRKDRPILPVTGVFKYDKPLDNFVFGDSSKVILNELKGNQLIFKNKSGDVEVEGKFDLGSGLKYINIEGAGTAKTKFPEPPPSEDIMLPEDSITFAPAVIKVDAEIMAGINLILPERLYKIIINDFKSSSFGATSINYLSDLIFYKKSVSELFPDTKETREAIKGLSSGYLDIPKKNNPYSFLFSKVPMVWDPDYQSFVSTSKNLGLVSISGEPINKTIESYLEVKMPTTGDDRLYVYIKSPSQLFYFFGFKQGILSVTSNNIKFMEEITNMKSKEKILKMDDGETYEIQEVDLGTANIFLRRIQAANKN